MSAVYIAAPLALFDDACRVANDLQLAGIRVVSTWHSAPGLDAGDPADDAARRRILAQNEANLRAASVVVACFRNVTERIRPRGAYVEIGKALAWDKTIVWVHAPGAGPDHPSRCIDDSDLVVTRLSDLRDIVPTVRGLL
jgi:nucleoside 2-deoxyribosyltransferase